MTENLTPEVTGEVQWGTKPLAFTNILVVFK
jgi:hypothetical protein